MDINRLFLIAIDGVDYPLAKEQDMLLESHVRWDLEEFPKLHTYRIWPSMYVGELPHRTEDLPDPLATKTANNNEVNWRSGSMRTLSRIAGKVIPHSIRKRIGAALINQELAKTEPNSEDWPTTVFDTVLSKVINVPVYNPKQVQKELKSGWENRVRNDDAGLETLADLAANERKAVSDELDAALDRGYDLTWAYIYGPDIFGHVDYSYSYPTEVERTWEEIVIPLRDQLGPNDELVVVSDHGMVDEGGVGEHRPPGWFATTIDTNDLPDSPTAVRGWIEDCLGARADRTEETLRDLGYLE